MADSFIQVPADDVGKKVDTESLTVGAETVQRERVQVAGAAAADVAAVTNAAPTTEYGLVTRNIPSGVQPVNDNGGSLTVDGAVAISGAIPAGTNNIGDVDVLTLPALPAGINNIGDVDVLSLPALPAGDNNIGNVDVVTMPDVTVVGKAADGAAVAGNPVLVAGQDGINAQSLKTDANGELQVDVLTLPALPAGTNNIGDVDVLTLPALPAGTNNIGDVDVLSLPALPAGTNNIGDVDVLTLPNVTLAAGTNTNEVVGDAADDAAAAGNPLSMGLTARQTNRTAVADGDAVRAAGDDMGRQVVVMNQVRDLVQQDAPITLSSTTETTLIAAGAAGVFHDLTMLLVTNSSATAVRVDFRDATAGTIRFSLALAANGGAVVAFPTPWKQTTAANNWTAQLSAAVTDVRIAAQAVKNV